MESCGNTQTFDVNKQKKKKKKTKTAKILCALLQFPIA